MQAVADNKADALEEARLAVEEIVIPRQQPIELLPRSPSVLELQVASARRADDFHWPSNPSSHCLPPFNPSLHASVSASISVQYILLYRSTCFMVTMWGWR